MACRCGRPAACVRKLTFTAWINQCLLETGLKVQDLEKDLGDGLVLLKLIETLSPGSRMPGRYVEHAPLILSTISSQRRTRMRNFADCRGEFVVRAKSVRTVGPYYY